MKIPSLVKIGGHNVRVKLEKEEFRSGRCGRKMCGQANFTKRLIRVATSNSGQKYAGSCIAETFMHEVLHHIADIYGVTISEQGINRLSMGVYQVLHDNKLRL